MLANGDTVTITVYVAKCVIIFGGKQANFGLTDV